MDPMWLALSKLRRGEHKECISLCDELLETNPRDQAAWLVKCRAVTEQNYIDDIELDEEGVADFLMDEVHTLLFHATNKLLSSHWLR
jgi:tetratricopeptide repeat protein 8